MKRRSFIAGALALGCGQDMQIGLGIGMGFGGGAAAVAAPTLPQTNLYSAHDIDYGVTLSTVMDAYGGATPAPTLSGTLTGGQAVIAKVRTTGDLTVATWNISFDGGITYPVHDVVIGAGGVYNGPGGLVMNFPAGTYTATATYTSRCASWIDTTNTWTFAQDGANAPPMVTGWGNIQNNGFNRASRGMCGSRGLMCNADRYLLNTGSWASGLTGGTGNTFHIFAVGHFDVAPNAGAMTLVGTGRSSSATPRMTCCEAAANAYTGSRINDANTQLFLSSGSADFLAAHIFEAEYDGATLTTRVDGNVVTSGASSGAMTQDRGTFFGLMRTTIGSRAIATMSDVVTYSSNLDSTTAGQVRTYLRSKRYLVARKANMNVGIEGASLSNPARGDLTWANGMLFGNDKPTVTNLATTGASLTDFENRAATMDAAYNGGLGAGHNILMFWNEANDIGLDGSGNLTTIKSRTAAYIAARKATGWKTVIKTLCPHGQSAGVGPSANYLTKAADMNAWIRAGSSGADYVDDVAATWPGGPDTHLELYDTDWIHVGFEGAHRVCSVTSEPLYRQLSALAA